MFDKFSAYVFLNKMRNKLLKKMTDLPYCFRKTVFYQTSHTYFLFSNSLFGGSFRWCPLIHSWILKHYSGDNCGRKTNFKTVCTRMIVRVYYWPWSWTCWARPSSPWRISTCPPWWGGRCGPACRPAWARPPCRRSAGRRPRREPNPPPRTG